MNLFLEFKVSKKSNFRNQFFFQRISKKFEIDFLNKFEKKLKKTEKVLFVKKVLFRSVFENYFSENEVSENWLIIIRIWFVFDQLQRPINWMCITQKSHLLTLNGRAHPDFWLIFGAIQFDARIWRYCYFKMTINLIPTDMNQFLKIRLFEKNLKINISKNNFSTKFQISSSKNWVFKMRDLFH